MQTPSSCRGATQSWPACWRRATRWPRLCTAARSPPSTPTSAPACAALPRRVHCACAFAHVLGRTKGARGSCAPLPTPTRPPTHHVRPAPPRRPQHPPTHLATPPQATCAVAHRAERGCAAAAAAAVPGAVATAVGGVAGAAAAEAADDSSDHYVRPSTDRGGAPLDNDQRRLGEQYQRRVGHMSADGKRRGVGKRVCVWGGGAEGGGSLAGRCTRCPSSRLIHPAPLPTNVPPPPPPPPLSPPTHPLIPPPTHSPPPLPTPLQTASSCSTGSSL